MTNGADTAATIHWELSRTFSARITLFIILASRSNRAFASEKFLHRADSSKCSVLDAVGDAPERSSDPTNETAHGPGGLRISELLGRLRRRRQTRFERREHSSIFSRNLNSADL